MRVADLHLQAIDQRRFMQQDRGYYKIDDGPLFVSRDKD